MSGAMPTALQGAILTCMVTLQQQDSLHSNPSFRSIGMLPSLYRVLARLRKSAAREWEFHHRRPYLRTRLCAASWTSYIDRLCESIIRSPTMPNALD
eukprot:5354889-Pyramimonas_sp.AAC.1